MAWIAVRDLREGDVIEGVDPPVEVARVMFDRKSSVRLELKDGHLLYLGENHMLRVSRRGPQ
jgi:hypothetical protein